MYHNSTINYIYFIIKKFAIKIMIGLNAKIKKGVSIVLKTVKINRNNINKKMVL